MTEDEEQAQFTIIDKNDKCLECKFYLWFDSGYRYCSRFPPKSLNLAPWWKKPKWIISYQLVEWDRKACGEFSKRINRRR